jgi:hypothetical protein
MELYRLSDEEATRIERTDRDEAGVLASYLEGVDGGRVGDVDLLFVRRERADDGMDVLAVDEAGTAVVVAATPGRADRSLVGRGLDAAARVAGSDHAALADAYRAETGEDPLRAAHADYFGLETPLAPTAFARDERVVLLASGFGDRSLDVASFLRARGVEVDPVEYAVFEDGDGLRFISTRPVFDGRENEPAATDASADGWAGEEATGTAGRSTGGDREPAGGARGPAGDGPETDGPAGAAEPTTGVDPSEPAAGPGGEADGADDAATADGDEAARPAGVSVPAVLAGLDESVADRLGTPLRNRVRSPGPTETGIEFASTSARHPDEVRYSLAARETEPGVLEVRVGLTTGGNEQAARAVGDRTGWLAEYDDVDLDRERLAVCNVWTVAVDDESGEAVREHLEETGTLAEVRESFARLIERWHPVFSGGPE